MSKPSTARIGLGGQKFSESLLAFKRTGKLPRTPHKTPRSERSIFQNYNSSQQLRSPTIRRVATAAAGRQALGGSQPLELTCQFACITSDFIQSKGQGHLCLYLDQVSLLEAYNSKIITEQSYCRARLVSHNESALDATYRVAVLDIDTSMPLTFDTYGVDDFVEVVMETPYDNRTIEFAKVKMKLALLPLTKERYEYHTLIGNEEFMFGMEYEVRQEEVMLSSGEDFVVLSQRTATGRGV